MSSIIIKPGNPNACKPNVKRDFNLWKYGFEAGEKLMIEKALEWFKNQKEEIGGISRFEDFEIRFRKAMEE